MFNLKGVRVQPSCRIDLRAKISCGASLFGTTRITKDVEIGRHTYATDAVIQNAIIGSFCSIAPGVKIGLNNHPLDKILTHPLGYDSLVYNSNLPKVVIGNDVWIAANAIILNGVVIGDGAVVAAGSVVNKNVNPFSVVGGIPATEIGIRNKHPLFDNVLQARENELKEIINNNRTK